jgi:hypothetical protein
MISENGQDIGHGCLQGIVLLFANAQKLSFSKVDLVYLPTLSTASSTDIEVAGKFIDFIKFQTHSRILGE